MKCFVFLNLIILVSLSLGCPSSEWFRFKNKCYLTDQSKLYLFRENVVFCESQHATTVSILSADENNFLTTKLTPNKGYWLGIKQVDFDNKTYEWLDGSPYNYSNWKVRFLKNCSGAFIFNGKWIDDKQSCDVHGSAFCEIEIYSTIFKALSQTNQETRHLNQEIKALDFRFNESIARLEDSIHSLNVSTTNITSQFRAELMKKEIQLNLKSAELLNKLNTQNLLIANSSSEFEAELRNKDHQVNRSLNEFTRLIEIINQSLFENEFQNRNRNQALENKVNHGLTLNWIFRLLLVSLICILIFSMHYKITKQIQWLRNEANSSNALVLVNNLTTENICERDSEISNMN